MHEQRKTVRMQQFANDEVIRLRSDVDNLVGWQKSQNGNLHYLCTRVDALQKWLMGLAAGLAVQLLLAVLYLLGGLLRG